MDGHNYRFALVVFATIPTHADSVVGIGVQIVPSHGVGLPWIAPREVGWGEKGTCLQEMLVHIPFIEVPCYGDAIVGEVNNVDIVGKRAIGYRQRYASHIVDSNVSIVSRVHNMEGNVYFLPDISGDIHGLVYPIGYA